MIVCKFGGKATVSKKAVNNLLMLCKNKKRKVLVFSAIGKEFDGDIKATDILITYTKTKNKVLLAKIIKKYTKLCNFLQIDFNIKKELNHYIKVYQKNKSDNYLISRGEYLVCKIISRKLKIKFVPAEKLMFFKQDQFDFNKIRLYLDKYINKYKRIIVPGFYGVDEYNNIVLFNRGGGDLTGGLLAKVIDFCLYENYTDVDGIFEKDPKIFKSKLIKKLSYESLEKIKGQYVVQDECVNLLKDSNITLQVKNINNLSSSGTIVKYY